MNIAVPTRQVATGTDWQSQIYSEYYTMGSANTSTAMSNSAEVNLTHSEYTYTWVPHTRKVTFFSSAWSNFGGDDWKYYQTQYINSNGLDIDDLTITSSYPSGIDAIYRYSDGTNTAYLTAYTNNKPSTDLKVDVSYNANHKFDVATGSVDIPVQYPYENVNIHTTFGNVVSYTNNENSIHVELNNKVDTINAGSNASGKATVTATYNYINEYATVSDYQPIYDMDARNIKIHINPTVGTLVNWYITSGGGYLRLYYTINGEKEDIGKEGRFKYSYEYPATTYATYADVRFTGPYANGASAINARVNYIYFNGERYP